jgi:hypothetical protein
MQENVSGAPEKNRSTQTERKPQMFKKFKPYLKPYCMYIRNTDTYVEILEYHYSYLNLCRKGLGHEIIIRFKWYGLVVLG